MLRFRPMMEMSTRRIIPAQELMTLLALFLLIVSNLISSHLYLISGEECP
jgi:hypothetical protein